MSNLSEFNWHVDWRILTLICLATSVEHGWINSAIHLRCLLIRILHCLGILDYMLVQVCGERLIDLLVSVKHVVVGELKDWACSYSAPGSPVVGMAA